MEVTIMGEQHQSSVSCVYDGGFKMGAVENSIEEPNRSRTESPETDTDWISKLPDSLIVQILSLLTLTEAVRTTILSKRWQYLWTFIDNIIFDWDIRWCPVKMEKLNEFISFTDNVMRLHSCTNIRRFDLSFMYHLDALICSKVDNWLEIALSKKVKNLYLELWPYYKEPLYSKKVDDKESYSLPQVLCNSDSLLKLHCKYCRLSDDCVLNWTSLKSLTLEHLFIRDEHIEQLTSSCPQLESLELHDFCGFHRLHLNSPKCRRLQLTNHRHPIGESPLGDDQDCWLEIVAPCVQHLKISGSFGSMKIRLGNLSSMVHADLNFRWNCYARGIYYFKDLLASIRCVRELTVPSWFIEVISMLMLEEEDLLLPLLECKQLTINSWFTKCSFIGIGKFLRSTPNLENLMILPARVYSAVHMIHTDVDYWDEDIDFSGDHFLLLQKDAVKGSLQNLKNVKVILVDCSSRIYIDDSTGLARFLMTLLENAINLEELVIGKNHRRCKTCSTRISKMIENLIAFPKASNSTVISLDSDSDSDSDDDDMY